MIRADLIIYLISSWFLLSSLYRFWKARRQTVISGVQVTRQIDATILSIAYSFSIFCISISLIFGAKLFFTGNVFTSIIVLAVILLMSSMVDAASAILYPASIKIKFHKIAASAIAILLGVSIFSFTLYLKSVPGKNSNAITLSFPVKSKWIAVTGGRTKITNYHHNNPSSQNYAVDIVKTSGTSEGALIYSPVDGIITEAIADRGPDSQDAEGNIIIIKTDDGVEIWLAHLLANSLLVNIGDHVESGQEIARCGSTGSAERAHVHIHAQRNSKPIPMLFGRENVFLLRNYIIDTESD